MSEYNVVMIVRDTDFDYVMTELEGVDFDSLGVVIVRQDDTEFDDFIGNLSESNEG